MKKTARNVIVLALATASSAFTNPTTEKMEVKSSTVNWTGKKITGKHNGTIQLKEGHLLMDGEELIGGQFVMDMTTIEVTDLTGEMKGKLEGHLNSDDFFGSNNFPTSTLVIKEASKKGNAYEVTGEITIKGVTEPITFTMTKEGTTANAKLKIDRTKFGIRYGSGSFFDNLGDNTIYDNFELDVTLNF